MPRQSRIDAPGALHHVIARGIERRDIFKDNQDKDSFLKRLGKIVTESSTVLHAWSLMPNHFHLLLKTGKVPLATIMRRLLTGYAVYFNRRHKRSGHLFQNRYKSILCEEDAYFKELVRYIHLNPLRANIVQDIKQLAIYPYSGHSAILGKRKRQWQSINSVLGVFDNRVPKARSLYRKFVESGAGQGNRPDLMGGGLVRSAGGWSVIKSLRKDGIHFKSDERILGDSNFVENVLMEAQEALESKYALAAEGVDLDQLLQIVGKLMSVDPRRIPGTSKLRDIVKARSLVCYWGSAELGLTLTELAKRLEISISTASIAAQRGVQLALENQYTLMERINMEI